VGLAVLANVANTKHIHIGERCACLRQGVFLQIWG
jgi:hypothetical protein